MQRLVDSLIAQWEAMVDFTPRVLLAAIAVLVFLALGKALGRGVGLLLKQGKLTPTHQLFFRRLVSWLALLIGFAVALNVVGLGGVAAGLLAGGGLTAVVLGFAFRQIGENLLAGLFLAFSRPFDTNDLVESGEFKGTVRKIELRHTHIRTADGRDIFIPNAQIFNSPLVNYTRDGLLRPSFTLGLDYRDDAGAACRLLAAEAAGVPGVLAEPAPAANVVGLTANVVEIEVTFWVNTFAKGLALPRVKGEVMERSRAALVAAGYTVSSEVSSRLEVALEGGAPGVEGDAPPAG